MKSIVLLTAAASGLLLAACHSGRQAAAAPAVIDTPASDAVKEVSVAPANVGLDGRSVAAVPKARIFKVHGTRPDLYVPITVNSDATEVLSFPAPSDLDGPMAILLHDNYWLDLRGISQNSRYTTLTVDEYKALGDSLTPAYLLTHLGDAAWPVVIVEMPFVTSDPDAVEQANRLIGEGLPECPILYARPFGLPIRQQPHPNR